MKFKMNNRTYVVLTCVALALLTGCASSKKNMYGWNDYQPEVYNYFKGSDAQAQIIVLEKNLEEFKAQNKAVPPGFHAHLGMLYAETGNVDRSSQEFIAEKTLFPESTAYMDFLLHKKDSGKTVSVKSTEADIISQKVEN